MYRLWERIKIKTQLYLLSENDHFNYKDSGILKVKRWRKTDNAKTNQRNAKVAILIPDKFDFGTRKIMGINRITLG